MIQYNLQTVVSFVNSYFSLFKLRSSLAGGGGKQSTNFMENTRVYFS